MWQMPYSNTSGSDEAIKVVVDNLDDVIVTGKSVASGKQEDIYTIKYNGDDGTKAWDYRYSTVFPDVPAALCVNADRDIALAGSSRVGNNLCFYTLKLSAAGAVVFDETYDGPDNNADYATGVAMDDSGNVTVTGTVINAGGTYAFHTKKYGPNGGNPLWSRTFNSPDSTFIDPHRRRPRCRGQCHRRRLLPPG